MALAQMAGCGSRALAPSIFGASVEHIRSSGCVFAVIGTGGDPGHAAARRTYEKAGFTALPTVRYYKSLA